MMIHRIEGAYLRTQDSLSKRDKDGRRRARRPVPSKPEETAEETAPARDHEADEATLDLVA